MPRTARAAPRAVPGGARAVDKVRETFNIAAQFLQRGAPAGYGRAYSVNGEGERR